MAFSVGMKLTQRVARQTAPPNSDAGALAVPLIASSDEASFDRKVVEATFAAVDARIHEYDGRVNRRLSDMEARLAVELQSLNRRHHTPTGAAPATAETPDDTAVRAYVDEKIAELRTQTVRLNQEFAEVVAGIVHDEVARQVEARATALERSLQEQIVMLLEAAAGRRLADAPLPLAEALANWMDTEPSLPPLPIEDPPAEPDGPKAER